MAPLLRAVVFFLLNEGVWVVLVTPALALFAGDRWFPGWADAPPLIAGLVLVAGGSALTVWAGYHLVARGEGTPFPIRGPTRLVTSGPYARVRNPQAIGGVVLMAGVALALADPVIWLLPAIYAGYVLVIQHTNERLTLQERFGDSYHDYRAAVPGWWPRGGRP